MVLRHSWSSVYLYLVSFWIEIGLEQQLLQPQPPECWGFRVSTALLFPSFLWSVLLLRVTAGFSKHRFWGLLVSNPYCPWFLRVLAIFCTMESVTFLLRTSGVLQYLRSGCDLDSGVPEPGLFRHTCSSSHGFIWRICRVPDQSPILAAD